MPASGASFMPVRSRPMVPRKQELDERSPIQRDVGMYGLTKLLAEAVLSRCGRRYDMQCRTVIFSTVLSDRPVSSPG